MRSAERRAGTVPRRRVRAPSEAPGTLFHGFFAHTGAEVVSATLNDSSPRRRAARPTRKLVRAR